MAPVLQTTSTEKKNGERKRFEMFDAWLIGYNNMRMNIQLSIIY